MSYSSEEYSGSYTRPSREYTQEKNYYMGSQFGPKLPATVPSMQYPILMEQGNPYGYDALTRSQNGQGYYDVATAYGNACNPKFYVGECPSNKYVRPFVPTIKTTTSPAQSCATSNKMISEGFHTAPKTDFQNLEVSFFYDKGCQHSRMAYDQLSKVLGADLPKTVKLFDIAQNGNAQMMTNLGGSGTPFFYSRKTGCSATGNWPIQDLVKALKCSTTPSPSSTPTTRESYVRSDMASKIRDLQLELFVMNGCGYCDKMKTLLKPYMSSIKITNAADARDRLQHVRGFPYIMSHKTKKSKIGYQNDLAALLQELS